MQPTSRPDRPSDHYFELVKQARSALDKYMRQARSSIADNGALTRECRGRIDKSRRLLVDLRERGENLWRT